MSQLARGTSQEETNFYVNCAIHGKVYLTIEEGMRQKAARCSTFICPIGRDSSFFNQIDYELVGNNETLGREGYRRKPVRLDVVGSSNKMSQG